MPLLSTQITRPNRLNEVKDAGYHVRMSKWTLNTLSNPQHQKFIYKTMVNWSFYKGGDGQWIFDEDLESFFLDESGDVRNRLKVTKNLIQPMVKQYIGNAVRLSYNARAKTTSDFVINRRERELNRMRFFYQVGKAIPEYDSIIRDRIPLGKSEVENEELFDSMFDDNFAENINNILAFTERDINMEEIKVLLSKHLAISGLGVYKGYEAGGKYVGEAKDPLFFIFDHSALKPDLSDAEFMGEWYYIDTPTLFERHQKLTNAQRQAIEKYSQNNSLDVNRILTNYYYMPNSSKIPVYEIYWKDIDTEEYGWVNDKFGYPYFTEINGDSQYTDKDLIPSPLGEKDKNLKVGEKKVKIYVDVMRYCIFIPQEEIGAPQGEDIVLEWGEVPYEEKYKYDPSSTKFPYKCYTWEYDKGEIIAPIDNAINPQRFVNRMYSIAESHVNNSRGTGTVIAKEAVDPRDGEETIQRNINNSKTVFVDTTRVGSVGNAIGTYGSGVNASVMNIYNIAREMQVAMTEITGINEAMTGTQGGSDALVGVIQANIERGSITQEPFYYGLTNILAQAYQHMATVGKKILYDNPRRAAIVLGDGGYEMLAVTEDMLNEDFRVFIERTESEPQAHLSANNLIFTLVQSGLLDSFRASMLFNRATPDQVAKAMREYQIELRQAKAEKSQMAMESSINQQKQEQQMVAQLEEEQMQQKADFIEQDERDKAHDIEKEIIRGDKKTERDVVNNLMRGG